jgi:PAS domain S-box-containing protein
LTGRHFYDLVHPGDREMFRLRAGTLGGENILSPLTEFRFLRLDGQMIHVESSEAGISCNGGRAIQVVFRDITRKKQTVEERKASTSELDCSQKIAHLGSWEFKLPDMEATWSDEAFRLLGLEPSGSTLDFKTWLEYVHPQDRDRVMMLLMESHRDPKPSKVDFRFNAGGQIKHVHLEWDVELDQQGNPLRVFGICQDITELRKTEAALTEAKAQAELYLDLMSHDINNMNHIAMGYLEFALQMIMEDRPIGNENRMYLEKPFAMLKSNSRLIDNVTKVRMEKAGAYQHEVIDIGRMLEGVREELAGVNGREIAIGLTCECACRVKANELLKDVFANLVGNAIKHSDPAKPLRIDIMAGKMIVDGRKYCRVIVEDNGPGIPDEMKRGLRERVLQDKPQSIGKGFGLYLVRILVKDYEGSLAMEDRVPGDYRQGCRFVVWLPAADQQ